MRRRILIGRFYPPVWGVAAIGLVAAAAAVTAILLISGSLGESSASEGNLYGIAKGAPLTETDLQRMSDTRVGAVRFLLSWPAIEAHRGAFSWTAPDQLIGGLASHGIQPIPFVYGSPRWLSPDPARPPIQSAASRAAWAAFLKAAVQRYGPGGTYWTTAYRQQYGSDARPVPITAWQIWNEPNLPHYYAPKPSPGGYAELLRVSSKAITQQDPGAQIVLAGMPGYGKPDTAWKFLGELYGERGFKGAFDVVALHPYARTVGQLGSEVEALRKVMARHGDGRTPLWLTEIGWGSGPPNRFGLNKGLQGQSRLLSESFRLILSHEQDWHVGRLFWFDWRDPPKGAPVSCSFCSTAGLLENDGTAKPSWGAYRQFASGQRTG